MISKKTRLFLAASGFSLISYLHSTASYTTVYTSNLKNYVAEAVQNLLTNEGVNNSQLPPQYMSEYFDKLDQLERKIQSNLRINGKRYTTFGEIETIARTELRSYVEKLKNVVPAFALQYKTSYLASELLKVNGIRENGLSYTDKIEFQNRINQVISKLQDTMNSDKRQYVRMQEISETLAKNLEIFITRVKKSQPKEVPFITFPKPDDGIQFENVGTAVASAAQELLTQNGVTDYTLDAIYISEYQQILDNIRTAVYKKMERDGKSSISLFEVKSEARNQLMGFINKISQNYIWS